VWVAQLLEVASAIAKVLLGALLLRPSADSERHRALAELHLFLCCAAEDAAQGSAADAGGDAQGMLSTADAATMSSADTSIKSSQCATPPLQDEGMVGDRIPTLLQV
jgi:hypothetical protein